MKPCLSVLALLLLVSLLPARAAAAVQPSFSCTNAPHTVELMICTHDNLAHADVERREIGRASCRERV